MAAAVRTTDVPAATASSLSATPPSPSTASGTRLSRAAATAGPGAGRASRRRSSGTAGGGRTSAGAVAAMAGAGRPTAALATTAPPYSARARRSRRLSPHHRLLHPDPFCRPVSFLHLQARHCMRGRCSIALKARSALLLKVATDPIVGSGQVY